MAVVLLAAACSSSSSSSSTSTPPATETTGSTELLPIDQATLQRTVDETREALLVPGVMVMVTTPSGTYRVSSGTTTLGEEIPPESSTHVRIASVTKTMTAAVILQLMEEGRLALDDTIGTYVDGVPEGSTITIAQLLEMRTGLVSYDETTGFNDTFGADPTHVFTPQDLLDLSFAEPMLFAPGEGYDYSNTNTILLGLVAEKLDGKPLSTSMDERLFEPLGLADTFLPDAATFDLPDPSSRGYQYGPLQIVDETWTPEQRAAAEAGTLQPNDVTELSPSIGWAAGGVISTADDLMNWIRALNRGDVLEDDTRQLWNDSLQVSQPENPTVLYGYGIEQIRFGDVRLTFHEGVIPGFNTLAVDDAANDVSMVVWTNRVISDLLPGGPPNTTAKYVWPALLADIYRSFPSAG